VPADARARLYPPKITSGKLMAHKMPEFVGV
jgi:hypothetical protein